MRLIAAVALSAALTGACAGESDDSITRDAERTTREPTTTERTTTTNASTTTERTTTTDAPTTTTTEPPTTTTTPPPPPTWSLATTIDGDTLEVNNGTVTETVRLIGIDAPERGECGFDEATQALTSFIGDADVTLEPGARDDRDSYDRLLRYVIVGGQDAGRVLLDQGLAFARYDSRDGYGAHPREAEYIAADNATPDLACPEPPSPEPPSPPPAEGGDVYFPNCDAARAAGAAPVHRGDPGYGSHLDRDGDGIGCE